jgi:hypothetical protein
MGYKTTYRQSVPVERNRIFEALLDFGNIKERAPDRIESVDVSGSGVGAERRIFMRGMETPLIERLEYFKAPEVICYSLINDAPLPVDRYHAVILLGEPRSGCCDIEWNSNWNARGKPEAEVNRFLESLYASSIAGLMNYLSATSGASRKGP